jgi:hypothetical protein
LRDYAQCFPNIAAPESVACAFRLPAAAACGARNAMKDSHRKLTVDWIYNQINLAAWGMATAFLIFTALFIVPQLPANGARYEAARQAELEAEHVYYCERLGFSPRAPGHSKCVAELQQFRRSVEKRTADQAELLF